MADSDDADKPRPSKAEREAQRKLEAGERDRLHDLDMAEHAARHKAELDKQQRDHDRAMAEAARAHQTMLAGQQSAQLAAHQNREHKVAWWGLIIALLTGFGGGVATCGTKYLERDVRNQVWQATYEDKERVAQTQSELLKLQEDYIGKLKQLQEGEAALAKANTELQQQQVEAQALRDESRRAIDALRSRYAALEAAERARMEKLKADKQAFARIEPWQMHGCEVRFVWDPGSQKSACGNRVVFAKDTPDEKVVVQPTQSCRPGNIGFDYEADENRCKVYGRSFLASKGLTATEIESILSHYAFFAIAQRWRETKIGSK